MQVINILGDEQQFAPPLRVEPGERAMGGVGLDRRQPRAARIAKGMDQRRIAAKGLRRGDILHPMSFPQAVRPPESGDSALR